MGNAGAVSAWNAGATGAGVSVGVIDSGINLNQTDLQGRISSLSTDVVVGRNNPTGTVGPEGQPAHGTNVSGVIASNFNGLGTVGVAYEATILSIRADISDCKDPDDTVCFRSSDLVRAVDYAIANRVRVINMSLGGEDPLGSGFEAALSRAVAAGIVFAIASGNEAGSDPEWPGRYASDPRFAGSIIVVGAHDRNNQIASFSNRAGVSAAQFISAAGVDVVTSCDGTSCWRVSGTSFSAPAVAGALALLLDAFPNLTGREAVQILLTTARDAGEAGTDATFGRGLLDLARAFQPIGSTSVQTASGQAVEISMDRVAYSGGAFGDAVTSAGGLKTVGRDSFQRLFNVDIAGVFGLAPDADRLRSDPAAPRRARVAVGTPLGGTLSLTSGVSEADSLTDFSSTSLLTPWLDDRRREDMLVEYSQGSAVGAYWQGRNGARSPFAVGAGDGFASLAQVDRAWLGSVRLGGLALTADAGVGDRRMPLQRVEEDVSRYTRFAAEMAVGPAGRLTFAGGLLDEKLSPLGGYAPSGSGLELPGSTRFASVAGRFPLGRGLRLDGELGWFSTQAEGRFLRLADDAVGSNWSLALTSFCGQLGLGCESLTWSVSQPLRVEGGTFAALLPDAPLGYFDETTFSERRFSATPSGRQIDFGLSSLHQLSEGSYLRLRGTVTRDDRHIADAAPGYMVSGSWWTRF